jgi:hypothetical protein
MAVFGASSLLTLYVVDESNRELKTLIDSGSLGKLHTIRSGSNDVYDASGTLLVTYYQDQ